MKITLKPLNGCVLVELGTQQKNFTVAEHKHDSRTNGKVLAVPDGLPRMLPLVGKTVFFDEYQEGARIRRDGKLLSFIKFEDVRGYDDEQAN